MRNAGGRAASDAGRGMPWCKHSGACRRFGAVNRRFRPPPARAARDLLLPKLIRGAIMVSKPPGIWRMSDKLSKENYHV
jgi:hypothetical protein